MFKSKHCERAKIFSSIFCGFEDGDTQNKPKLVCFWVTDRSAGLNKPTKKLQKMNKTQLNAPVFKLLSSMDHKLTTTVTGLLSGTLY